MPAARAQNGWPALEADSPLLHTWVIPTEHGEVRLKLRNGSAGLVLAHHTLWFDEAIEPLPGKILDEWGWAYRPVRGQTTGLSNHAAGCAVDLNATRHPRGNGNTWTPLELHRIHARLDWLEQLAQADVIRWGQDYERSPKDGMHFEVIGTLAQTERLAKRLVKTPRGKRLLKANPGQLDVINS